MATYADWVARFVDESPRDGLAPLVAMHRLIADRIRAASRIDKLLQVGVLMMSALTSGALWVLVGAARPVIASWVGAALSTLVTALTLYELTVRPGREAEQLNDLHEQLGLSLAHVHGAIRTALAGTSSRVSSRDTSNSASEIHPPSRFTTQE